MGRHRIRARRLAAWLPACLIGVAGCAPAPPSPAPQQAGERPVETLEQRLQTLSDKYAIMERSARDPEQIRQHIGKLEEERQSLLKRYTEAHPSVVQVDRQLRQLKEWLRQAEGGQ